MSDDLVQQLAVIASEARAYGYGEFADVAVSARNEIERLRAEVAGLRIQYDDMKDVLYDEIAANLAFRESGGALPDEDMPTFCARLVAERDALRERIARAPTWFYEGKPVALVPIDD